MSNGQKQQPDYYQKHRSGMNKARVPLTDQEVQNIVSEYHTMRKKKLTATLSDAEKGRYRFLREVYAPASRGLRGTELQSVVASRRRNEVVRRLDITMKEDKKKKKAKEEAIRVKKAQETPQEKTMPSTVSSRPLSMKKGGKIKKTGVYKLHKGEKVVPAKKAPKKASKKKSNKPKKSNKTKFQYFKR